jgi:predicted transcriptional regulator
MPEEPQTDIASLTVQLLSAFVANNLLPSESLPDLIRSTRLALTADLAPMPEVQAHTPAVSIKKSLASKDHIFSLIDGKPYKTLKRHLAKHGLTPAKYRERYALPDTYPMVAEGYSAERRAVAKKLGLGNRGLLAKDSTPPSEAPAPEAVRPVKLKSIIAPKTVNKSVAASATPKASAAKGTRPAKVGSKENSAIAIPVAEAPDPSPSAQANKPARRRKLGIATGDVISVAATAQPDIAATSDSPAAKAVKPRSAKSARTGKAGNSSAE